MRKTLIALLLVPVAALAQATPKDKAGPDPARMEKMEKRMRLARTLGLAEALDLDTAQALKLGDTLARFDDRRQAARKQAHEAREALRTAAQPDGKATATEVDGAIARLMDSRVQLHAIDKDMLAAVTKDLTPQQRARAALFLGRFRERIERRVMPFGPGMGRGPGSMEGGPGGMRGMRGPGGREGHGMMGGGMGGGPGMQDCPMTGPGGKAGPTGALFAPGGDRLSAWSGGSPGDDAGFDPPPFTDEEED
jgi:Spy/CpxP family protein refolding chaperone